MTIWQKIENKLGEKIVAQHPVGGGCINQTYVIETENSKKIFCKINHSAPLDFFEKESEGLKALSQVKTWKVSSPLLHLNAGNTTCLLMEYVEKKHPTTEYWQNLGRSLAELHKIYENNFGWKDDNYIGSLKQINNRKSSWEEFFISNRIEPLVKLALDKKIISKSEANLFTLLETKILNIFPKEKPALIHGDLWSGNVMPTIDNTPAIYDPAAYFGHREQDLAMTILFGGFPSEFYRSYQQHFPLHEDFLNRKDFYNLYPLLVHLILFGRSYWYDIEQILRKLK